MQRPFALAAEILEFAEITDGLNGRYYFRDRLCRCAMSVPANIAEGNGRGRPQDYASFVGRARGSLFELDTWLLAEVNRCHLGDADYHRLASEVQELSAMLLALRNSLRRKASGH